MKIQFLTTYYPPFLKAFYARNPSFSSLTFQQMLYCLLQEYFADTGAFYHHSIKHNHECFLIVANCEPLQKKWAAENNFKYTEKNWEKEIALAQAKYFSPDVFYIESVFDYYGSFLKEVKEHSRFTAAWISTIIDDQLNLNYIDLIISSTPNFVEQFRKKGIKSEYMLPAFDARVIDLLDFSEKKDIPFSFVGGWSSGHVNRRKALEQLVVETSIQLWGYGFRRKEYSKKTLKYYKNILFPENDPIMNAYRGELWGIEMYTVLKRSLVTFNIHEILLKGKVGNMRMFEATGVGTMIMNDEGSNLSEIFIPGKEIETYHSIDEAIEKTNYYLKHPEKAIEIGKNAQQRTIKDYNYDVFVSQFITHLKKNSTL
jgi:spore maturation protein CgeB